jgi:dihydropteroate synthase
VRVSAADEIARVVPVVRALAAAGVRVSVDTVKADVAAAAIDAGARIVNDVSMGASSALLELVASRGVDLVLMHTRGRGEVAGEHVRYDDVVADVLRELSAACARAEGLGVARSRIWIDPGIGFSKTAAQSVALLARTDALVATGRPVLVGPSRKAFIGATAPRPDGSAPAPAEREPGTLAAVTAAILGGARAVRVHDVRAAWQAVRVAEAIRDGGGSSAERGAAPC